ncbi:MAG TPA: protein translocase subunit SecD, partial [Acidimicrobiia bacterium]|nr:protein translocase subunit SecD [Acidimicrobiia bacterium]
PTTTTTSTTSTTAPGETATEDAETTTTTASTVPPDVDTTDREENAADQEVVLPETDDDGVVVQRHRLGPAMLKGDALASANARIDPTSGQWYVDFELTGAGTPLFDQAAAACFGRTPQCPTGQLGIELDGDVVSTPVVNQANFGGSGVIEGGFSEREAKDLALVLRYGALPVQLEQQTVRTVSATLGEDSLRAGLIAGALGSALVIVYMLLYYRVLGLVVIIGLAIGFALQWSIISWLGETQGLALSLAGVTGIVVGVGMTVDTYVVYFERLKDDLRAGRTVRSAVDRSFKRAFRTIMIANTSALIGAAVLYMLTVGPVRGFAFFLGLVTVLDIVVAWFFTRPAVAMLAASPRVQRSRFIGGTGS